MQSRFAYQYQVHLQNKNKYVTNLVQYHLCSISHIHFKLFFVATRHITFLSDISQVQTEEIRRVSLRRPVQRLGAPREDTAALDDRKL